MVRNVLPLRGVLIAGLLLLSMGNRSFASELIEPTRTLSAPAGGAGVLSVFSEPPGLDVTFDGARIGKTPVVDQKVASGRHVVGVKGSETEIQIRPGKSSRLSWFKGEFIEIPAETTAEALRPGGPKRLSPQATMSPPRLEKREKPDPFYWPLNPKGPID